MSLIKFQEILYLKSKVQENLIKKKNQKYLFKILEEIWICKLTRSIKNLIKIYKIKCKISQNQVVGHFYQLGETIAQI
jgi:hypothetical protein